jgi:hypothetical protein
VIGKGVQARSMAVALLLCVSSPAGAAPFLGLAPVVDPASIPVPSLAFIEDAETAKTYDKYFYFQRDDTDFATAYADLRECDAYARGLTFSAGNTPIYPPYAGTLAGAVGGAIGSALADAVYGSAERRAQRRTNLRVCMGYKGYRRYGLPKTIWTQFNFEEGLKTVAEDERQKFLRQQAKIASGPKPDKVELR